MVTEAAVAATAGGEGTAAATVQGQEEVERMRAASKARPTREAGAEVVSEVLAVAAMASSAAAKVEATTAAKVKAMVETSGAIAPTAAEPMMVTLPLVAAVVVALPLATAVVAALPLEAAVVAALTVAVV